MKQMLKVKISNTNLFIAFGNRYLSFNQVDSLLLAISICKSEKSYKISIKLHKANKHSTQITVIASSNMWLIEFYMQ